MSNWMTCREAAQRWACSERWISILCKSGKVPGAEKRGRGWLIPVDAPRPADGRIKSGAYQKRRDEVPPMAERRPLPLGISDFASAAGECRYVDRTRFAAQLLSQRPESLILTRPHRWGKTLLLDMVRRYFEDTGENTSALFRDRAVWSCGERVTEQQGRYPVVILSCRDLRFDSWAQMRARLGDRIRLAFARHSALLDSGDCDPHLLTRFRSILEGDCGEAELSGALEVLILLLEQHHGTRPILLVDDYDAPLLEAARRGFGDAAVDFMSNLLSGALKDNPHLRFGVLTGVVPVLLPGLEHLRLDTVAAPDFSLGFTAGEIDALADGAGDQLARHYGVPGRDGEKRCCPGAVLSALSGAAQPVVIRDEALLDCLDQAGQEAQLRLLELLQGATLSQEFDLHALTVSSAAALWGRLLSLGYLSARPGEMRGLYALSLSCTAAAGELERHILLRWAEQGLLSADRAAAVREVLRNRDLAGMRPELGRLFSECLAAGGGYPALALGLQALVGEQYRLSGSWEGNPGRFCLQLFPKSGELPVVALRVRSGKRLSDDQLRTLAQTALGQISPKSLGVKPGTAVLKFGAARSGEEVRLVSES